MKSYLYILSIFIVFFIICLYKKAYSTKVILFHSPNCPHCVKMMPEWNNLVSKAKFSTSMSTYEINVDNKDDVLIDQLKKNYNITSWPTIIIIKEFKWRVYDGNMTSEEIWNSTI